MADRPQTEDMLFPTSEFDIRLTRREKEVLRLIAAGCADREIAAALAIRPRTVEWHGANLRRKLGAGTRTALAAYAIHHGIE